MTPETPIPPQVRTIEVDAIQISAPLTACHHVRGTNGEMWQWYGSGTNLITRIVVVRRSYSPTPSALRHLLNAELVRISKENDSTIVMSDNSTSSTNVPGSRAAFRGRDSGLRHRVPVHEDVLMACDENSLYLSRVVVPENPSGRELAASINSSMQITRRRH